MRRTALLRLLQTSAAVIAVAPLGMAQNITGSITGTVHDQTGAVIKGAEVTVRNADTGLEIRKVTTDANGIYVAPLLPIGHYTVTASYQGFADSKVTSIELHVNDQLKYDLTMMPASTGQTISVEANPLQVETEEATAAGLINATQIRELSLNNRNYEQMVALQPGVTYGGGDQLYVGLSNPSGQTNVVSFSINGQRNSANNWTIDGADNVDRGSNLTLLNYPSIDAIAEFKTLRAQYNPEYGRNAGGQINVVTKSGTDQFHGDAYEFFRNNVLNANTYFNKLANPIVPRNPLRYNDFGYTVGGPVKAPGLYKEGGDKTFFFFSEEFRRVITYSTLSALVPTANQRNGIFSAPVGIYNPATGTFTSGTQITNINPVAAQYMKDVFSKIPLPNAPSINANTLLSSVRNVYNARQELVRLDHNFGDKLTVAFRFINDSIPTQEPGGLFTGSQIPGLATTNTNAPGRNYLGRFTYTVSPTMLIDGGYADSYGGINSTPAGLIAKANSPDVNPALPFTSTLARIPTLTLAGLSGVTGYGPYNEANRDHQVFANLTKVWNNHSLKFGGVYHNYEKTENASGNNTGSFSFDSTGLPKGSSATTLMQSWANFLSGYVTTFTQVSQDLTPDLHSNQFELYGQDGWKVRPNLTVTYGVRWSVFGAPTDSNHLLTSFDPKLYNPATANVVARSGANSGKITTFGDQLDGVIVNGKNSPWGDAVSPTNYLNFAPRLGVAWDPFGTGKTSIRAGYGMVYDSSLFGDFEQNIFANPPYLQSTTLTAAPFDSVAGGTKFVNTSPLALRAAPVTDATPYVQSYSLDVQQELPGQFMLDIGYFGSKDTHLLGIVDINQPLPGAYATAGLTDRSGKPITAGTLTSANIYAINAIRPYAGFDAINAIEPWFSSNYNSLQASVQKRFKGGSLISVNYTWSHSLTDNQTDRSTAPQNTYCIQCEYGPSQLDRRNVLTANFVYNLPFFQAQHGTVGHVLGGWEMSGIIAANSGLPLTVTTSSTLDPAGQGVKDGNSVSGPRPNQIGDPNSGAPQTRLNWFNTGAFQNVAAGQLTPGTERRGAVLGPGFWRADLSLFKNIRLTERFSAQFRAEAFNVFNHTNFDGVGTNISTTSTFGQITSARDPRIMQLALKFYF